MTWAMPFTSMGRPDDTSPRLRPGERDGAAPPRHQRLPPRPRGALRRRPQARPAPRRDARALRRMGARLPRGGARPRRPARADPPRGRSRGPAARGREQPQGLDPRDEAPRLRACRRLGTLVANAGKRPLGAVVADYGAGFMEALRTQAPST